MEGPADAAPVWLGLAAQDVLELFRFIDWIMALPAELEEQFAAQGERTHAIVHRAAAGWREDGRGRHGQPVQPATSES